MLEALARVTWRHCLTMRGHSNSGVYQARAALQAIAGSAHSPRIAKLARDGANFTPDQPRELWEGQLVSLSRR